MSDAKSSIRIMGKKVGMTRIFDDKGNLVVCTVIAAEPNVVTQVKTVEKDGYTSIQLAAERLSSSKKKTLCKPQLMAYEKKKIDPRRTQFESRLSSVEGIEEGAEFGVDLFAQGEFLDVTAVTKGKGCQGVIKRHGHRGGPAAHGSGFHRHGGSTGMRTTPGRTFPGMKMPGHMGAVSQTVQNLQIVKVDAEKHVVLVRGSVPGSRGANVWMKRSPKKIK
jgi:large subunit ribosomal protein L3